MKALLIVDVQNDFLPGGALGISGGDAVIPVINALQDKFELIVATQDWHPAGHCSFASTHARKPGEKIDVEGRAQELWPEHCLQNSQGAAFPMSLRTERIAKVFYKGTDPEVDSYSAFFDNAHTRSTGLADFLKEQGVEEIYIVGLATDYCVRYSVRDARMLGFKVTVALDGCKGIELEKGDIDRALGEMKELGAHLLMAAEV